MNNVHDDPRDQTEWRLICLELNALNADDTNKIVSTALGAGIVVGTLASPRDRQVIRGLIADAIADELYAELLS